MKTRALLLSAVGSLALVASPAASLVGCANYAGDETGSTGESLDVLVHLPTALGGGDRTTRHALDAIPSHVYATGLPKRARAPSHGGVAAQSNPTQQTPTTTDLSQDAPAPGDQGQTGSCAAWATGYSSMGWWAAKTGLAGAPFAPMYLYAQEVQGSCDQGTYIEGNMDILQQQGIDTSADYEPMEQNLDCATQPNAQQTANAAHAKISGYRQLDLSGGARAAIEQMLAAGYPVVLGIQAYSELMNANASNYLVGPPSASSHLYGGHAIAAFKYDENGVWILNSWTDQWGNRGWAELSWAFLEGSHNGEANLMDAAAITGVVGGGGGGGGGGNPPPSSGPSVGFASPVDGSSIAPGASVAIAVTATDASSSIASASLHWQGPAGASDYTLSSLGNDQWGITLQLSAQARSGARTLTVTVTDSAGQSAQAVETLQVP
jgi:hypothetical protein